MSLHVMFSLLLYLNRERACRAVLRRHLSTLSYRFDIAGFGMLPKYLMSLVCESEVRPFMKGALPPTHTGGC